MKVPLVELDAEVEYFEELISSETAVATDDFVLAVAGTIDGAAKGRHTITGYCYA